MTLLHEIKEFWEQQHRDKAPEYVTGISGLAGLRELFPEWPTSLQDMIVLCVGVGDGTQVEEMAADGCREVHGADISETGLSRVQHLLAGSYLFPHFNTIPGGYFDVVVSRAVICHIDNVALQHHLEHLIRCLAPTGSFFLQSNFSLAGRNVGDRKVDNPLPCMKGGGVWRSYGYLAKELYRYGGVIVSPPKILAKPNICADLGWYGLHIQRGR